MVRKLFRRSLIGGPLILPEVYLHSLAAGHLMVRKLSRGSLIGGHRRGRKLSHRSLIVGRVRLHEVCLRNLAVGDLTVRALILEEEPRMAMAQVSGGAEGVRGKIRQWIAIPYSPVRHSQNST